METSAFTGGGNVFADTPSARDRDETGPRNDVFVRLEQMANAVAISTDAVSNRRSTSGGVHSVDPLAAGRRIAAMTPVAERDALYAEQRRLALKKVNDSLTPAEERRLKIVRWNIDRIEDAEFGPALDLLDKRANMVDKVATSVQAFLTEVQKRRRW